MTLCDSVAITGATLFYVNLIDRELCFKGGQKLTHRSEALTQVPQQHQKLASQSALK
jgi:hypothetical protein